MFDFSPVQIIIVLIIALVVFGPKRLPEMGRNLGRSMREFKSSISGDDTPAQTHHDPTVGELPELAKEEVAAHQTVPAPTPEIAQAEAVDAVAEKVHASKSA